MKPKFIKIGDIKREYIWPNQIMGGGRREEWDETSVCSYRRGEIGLLHPLILDFYDGKTESWKIPTDFLGMKVSQSMPLCLDRIHEPPKMASYDFNPKNRLALVIMDNFNYKLEQEARKGFVGAQYVLFPVREGEYNTVSEQEARKKAEKKAGWLSSFEKLIENEVLRIEEIPIEIIARTGEIDRSKLRVRAG